MLLEKYRHNPILSPTKRKWESKAVFNCGATVYKNKIYLLYRAVGKDNISRLGLAISKDGYTIDERFPNPIYEPVLEFEQKGVEDPRITKIGNTYYIVYTGFWDIHNGCNRTRIVLTRTKNFEDFDFFGIMLPGENNKDGALFPKKIRGRYVLLHRRMPNMYVAYSDDLISWCEHKAFLKPKTGRWDSVRIGAGAPPIKTKYGWLLIYHGVGDNEVYRLGMAMLDLNKPENVLHRYNEPILEPTYQWEKEGLINNVVFTCGVAEFKNKYFVYYGGADKHIGVATMSRRECLKHLR